MKKKLVDSSDWQRLIRKRYKQTYVNNEEYSGYISILYIDKVKEPLIILMEDMQLCLAKDGYKWVKFVPDNSNYAVITMYDSNDTLIQWYFDIIDKSGIDEDGKLFFDDLYLDVAVLPQKGMFLLDEDELEEALNEDIITMEQYKLAYKSVKALMSEIENNNNNIINDSKKYLEYMENLLQ